MAEPPIADHTVATNTGGHQPIWDRLGILGSALCLIHCAVTPLFIGYLSAAGLGFLGSEIVHKFLAAPLLVIALLAFWPGYRTHQNRTVIAAGAAGVASLVMAIFILEPMISEMLETTLTAIGSVLLIGAHTANWRLASDHGDCPDKSCE